MSLISNDFDFLSRKSGLVPLVTPLLASLVLIIWLVRIARNYGQRSALMPPGPPTLPIIGNAHVFPKSHIEQAFSKWGKRLLNLSS